LGELYGTRARINIYKPKVKTNSKDFSASSIQLEEKTELGYSDAIGAGSWVWPSKSGDNFARFHFFWVNHNYLF
jgi:hypothetical protein